MSPESSFPIDVMLRPRNGEKQEVLVRNTMREMGFCYPGEIGYSDKSMEGKLMVLDGLEDGVALDLTRESLGRRLYCWPPITRMCDQPSKGAQELGDLTGFSQLFPNRRVYPPNWVSRGDHAFRVAYAAAAVCRFLSLECPDEFFAATAHYGIDQKVKPNTQRVCQLAFLMGGCHDLHPVWGDMMKIMTEGQLDERRVIRWAMADDDHWKYFAQMCLDYGFPDAKVVRDLIIRMVDRRGEDFLSKLVHGPSKDEADLDLVMYTLADLVYGLQDLCFDYGQEGRFYHQSDFDHFLEELTARLKGEPFDPHRRLGFSLAACDPLRDISLKDGQIVYSDPLRLLNLVRLSSVLWRFRYYSPKFLGPELAARWEWQNHRDRYPSDDTIMCLSLSDFLRLISGSPLEEIHESRVPWQAIGPLCEEGDLPFGQKARGLDMYFGRFPVKLRLGTLVWDGKEVASLISWTRKRYPEVAADLERVEERYRSGWLVLQKAPKVTGRFGMFPLSD